MVTTVSPNASATPTKPIPSRGKAAANTAAPHPPSTSQAVPMNSATSFRIMIFPTAKLVEPMTGLGQIRLTGATPLPHLQHQDHQQRRQAQVQQHEAHQHLAVRPAELLA